MNTPLAYLELPARPTEPTSPSNQVEGRPKVGTAVTVSVIVVVFVKLPDVPVIVTRTVPVDAVLLAVSVNVLVVVAGFELNAAVTPLGRPDGDKVTPPLKPFCGVTAIVLVPLVPCVMLRLFGDADRV
jgi:hypothetical protein